jgi:hypothetical protein
VKRNSADNIIWSENNINELRELLRQGEVPDDEEVTSQQIYYPWPVDVVKTTTNTSASGASWVSALLQFDPMPDATEYEIRSSVYSKFLDIPPVTEWTLNGIAKVVDNYVQLVDDGPYLPFDLTAGSAVLPDFISTNFERIIITAQLELMPTTDGYRADGFYLGLIDSDLYPDTYIGGSGDSIGMTNGLPGTLGVYMTTLSRTFKTAVESYDLTGAAPSYGPFDNYRSYYEIPDGTLDIIFTIYRTGIDRCVVEYVINNETVLLIGNCYLPSFPRIYVSAAYGAISQEHRLNSLEVEVVS